MNLENFDLTAMSSLKPATGYTSTSVYDAVKLRLGKSEIAAAAGPQNIPQYFRSCCQKFAEQPALVYEKTQSPSGEQSSSEWVTLTYAEFSQQVEQAALILLHVGLQPRSSVGILAFNCPEWFYAEFGTLRAGGVVAGIYPTSSPEAIYHLLDTSDATVCIVDDAQQMAKVRAVRSRLPRLHAVMQLHGPYEEFVGVEDGYYRWEDYMNTEFSEQLRVELERRERNVGANECAMLIYTSGTVGMPKAVMLSHDAILHDAKIVLAGLENIEGKGEKRGISYLPLNHIAAQIVEIFMALDTGTCIYFADRNALKGTLGRTLVKARPTRLFGVPRVFEKIQEKLSQVEGKSSSVTRYIMDTARQIVMRYHLDTMENKCPSSLKYWLASKITMQVKVALGMDCCKAVLCGGAPTSDEVKHFFLSLDMPIIEVYGMSETGGAITLNTDMGNLKSVGKPLEGVELKVKNPDHEGQGEICIRGRTVFMGYLNNEEKTKEALTEDGWLYSGDLGYLDTQGNLVISGRIKELVITAGGENIPPAYIEDCVKRELPGISYAMVVGDRKKYLTILLTLKTEVDTTSGYPLDNLRPEAIDWLRSLGLEFSRLSQVLNTPKDLSTLDASNVPVQAHPKVLQAIHEGIQRANSHAISNAQKVQKFSILPHDFSMATGELGPTLKLRRNIVVQKYANIIEQMYK